MRPYYITLYVITWGGGGGGGGGGDGHSIAV